jgi:hypothetical protein
VSPPTGDETAACHRQPAIGYPTGLGPPAAVSRRSYFAPLVIDIIRAVDVDIEHRLDQLNAAELTYPSTTLQLIYTLIGVSPN